MLACLLAGSRGRFCLFGLFVHSTVRLARVLAYLLARAFVRAGARWLRSLARSCVRARVGFVRSRVRSCGHALASFARSCGRAFVCSSVARACWLACSRVRSCGRAFGSFVRLLLVPAGLPAGSYHLLARLLDRVRAFKTFIDEVYISITIINSVIANLALENEVLNARQLKCRQSNPHFHLERSCTSQGTKDCQMLNSYAVQTTGKMTCVL